ncbi:uncharacterized protein LOC144441352 [Glandiceps talaboti]
MANSPEVKTYFEIYFDAYYFGEDRRSQIYGHIPIKPSCKFEDVKQRLDKETPPENHVVLKDMAYTVTSKLEYLPTGYQHTFLIRHPVKVFLSVYNIAKKTPINRDRTWPSDFTNFRAIGELYDYVINKTLTDRQIVIVDADDIQRDPARMFEKYCHAVGLCFNESMLHWDRNSIPEYMMVDDPYEDFECWYGDVLQSDGFKQNIPWNVNDADISVLPREFQIAMEESMPVYNMLWERRLPLD